MKPFKPPTLVERPVVSSQHLTPCSEPPSKKRRISHESEDDKVEAITAAANVLKQPKPLKRFQAPVRKPLDIKNVNESLPPSSQREDSAEGYYTVLW